MSGHDLTCREFVDVIMAYFDGELAAEPLAVFEEHIRLCPPCEVYLDTYRRAVELAGELHDPCGDEPVPEDVPESLVRAVLEARKKQA